MFVPLGGLCYVLRAPCGFAVGGGAVFVPLVFREFRGCGPAARGATVLFLKFERSPTIAGQSFLTKVAVFGCGGLWPNEY